MTVHDSVQLKQLVECPASICGHIQPDRIEDIHASARFLDRMIGTVKRIRGKPPALRIPPLPGKQNAHPDPRKLAPFARCCAVIILEARGKLFPAAPAADASILPSRSRMPQVPL